MSPNKDEKRPTRRSPYAVKAARTVATGGWENTLWLCVLSLPTRYGERISIGFVESTVNQVISKRFCKKQQIAWTPRGAHLLLQIRTRVLNRDWEATFREWYPGFRATPQAVAA
jgi:hypothetical protein